MAQKCVRGNLLRRKANIMQSNFKKVLAILIIPYCVINRLKEQTIYDIAGPIGIVLMKW